MGNVNTVEHNITCHKKTTNAQLTHTVNTITYANSDKDGAETEDDYFCEMEDGLERGA